MAMTGSYYMCVSHACISSYICQAQTQACMCTCDPRNGRFQSYICIQYDGVYKTLMLTYFII